MKSAKKWLTAAAVLVIVGAILFAAAMTAYRWDFTRLSADRFVTNTYEIREDFTEIRVNTGIADVLFALSDDDTCRVVCFEEENQQHSALVRDGILTVSVTDGREWYEHIGFSFDSPSLTLYLPKTGYGSLVIEESTGDITIPADFTFGSVELSLSTGGIDCLASSAGRIRIETSTGDIRLRELSAGELDLTTATGQVDVQSVSCEGGVSVRVSTGETRLTDLACRSLRSDGSTGDIAMQNVVAAETISVERSTGDVRFERCDAAELTIETDTGSVTGSLLTEKVFLTDSDTGRVDVPRTVTGGKCEIRTDTGDIRVEIVK